MRKRNIGPLLKDLRACLCGMVFLGDVVDPGVEWAGSPVGVSDNLLSNNSLEGWYNGFNDDFSTIPPALPLGENKKLQEIPFLIMNCDHFAVCV